MRLPERGGAVVVLGEAGIGKSALLEVARRGAVGRGFSVLSVSGVESEAHLSFSGLHQLLRPALGALDQLPVRQREAVEAAFGMSDSAAPDAFLIALATLDLLVEMTAETALVILVEDAHWLDPATSDVLAFVARRLELEPIAVVFAVREGSDGAWSTSVSRSCGSRGWTTRLPPPSSARSRTTCRTISAAASSATQPGIRWRSSSFPGRCATKAPSPRRRCRFRSPSGSSGRSPHVRPGCRTSRGQRSWSRRSTTADPWLACSTPPPRSPEAPSTSGTSSRRSRRTSSRPARPAYGSATR